MLLSKTKPLTWNKITDLTGIYEHLMGSRPAQGTGRLSLRSFRINTLYASCDLERLLRRGTYFKGVDAQTWNEVARGLGTSQTWTAGGFFSKDVLRAASFIGGRNNPPRLGLQGAIMMCDDLAGASRVAQSEYNVKHEQTWPSDWQCSAANILGFMYVEHTALF